MHLNNPGEVTTPKNANTEQELEIGALLPDSAQISGPIGIPRVDASKPPHPDSLEAHIAADNDGEPALIFTGRSRGA